MVDFSLAKTSLEEIASPSNRLALMSLLSNQSLSHERAHPSAFWYKGNRLDFVTSYVGFIPVGMTII